MVSFSLYSFLSRIEWTQYISVELWGDNWYLSFEEINDYQIYAKNEDYKYNR